MPHLSSLEVVLMFFGLFKKESLKDLPVLEKVTQEDLAKDKAKATVLLELREHTTLLIEYFDDDNQYHAKKVHLRGRRVISDPLKMFTEPSLFYAGFYRAGKIEIKELADKEIRYKKHAGSWIVDKEDALHLIHRATLEQDNNTYFNILGNGSISSSIAATFLNQRSHNCFTWARERLMITGVNIPASSHIKLLTRSSTEAEHIETEAMDLNALCQFVRSDDKRSIQRWYAKDSRDSEKVYVNPNTLAWRVTKGPSEFLLGEYTPLMLAASYGHHKTVKLLIDDYAANPYINSKARFGFGILGRYSAFDCANSLVFRPYVSKAKQQSVNDVLESKDHERLLKEALNIYITKRSQQAEYTNQISVLNHSICSFGVSKTDKIKAATALLYKLNGDEVDLEPHKRALQNGELGKMFADYRIYGLKQMSKKASTKEEKLDAYITSMEYQLNLHKKALTLFGHELLGFGCDKQQKLEAAKAWRSNTTTANMKKVLENGELGQIVRMQA
jgi:hypothetical protein